jgi:hypothetical protein
MTNEIDLNAIKARLAAATPGPWEDGEVWGTAGVNPRMFGDGKCTYCNLGEPAWTGRTDINGAVMEAHRHRLPDPYAYGWRITTTDGIVADDIARTEDQAFIRHAIEDIPALIAEVERLRREHDPRRGSDVEAWVKQQRDLHPKDSDWSHGWYVLDDLLNDYRDHADCGVPLGEKVSGPHPGED